MALWESLRREDGRPAGVLGDLQRSVPLSALESASSLAGALERLRGRAVMVAVRDQLTAALAMIELDGLARRMVIVPEGTSPKHLDYLIRTTGSEVWLGDAGSEAPPQEAGLERITAEPILQSCSVRRQADRETDWVLLTSGTSGPPKLVRHSLSSLVSYFADRGGPHSPIVWSTFYDIRRYGGMQIFLRALLGGSLLLPGPGEPVQSFLTRAAAAGVTHISGTPSHWRKALMSGAGGSFSPAYVRLSGEIADQGILDALRAAFPTARVAHAFASTEAGVAFEVEDGLAGFPATLMEAAPNGVELDISRGTLRLRSAGNALGYLGDVPPLKDPEGFVDTGDRLDLRAGRYYFMGRSGGIINVGGLKVHPEEVEGVINSHPAVRMSQVKARRNPITGAVVAAEVVLERPASQAGGAGSEEAIRREILTLCRAALAAHKVPALIRFVPSLALSASGKLVRTDA